MKRTIRHAGWLTVVIGLALTWTHGGVSARGQAAAEAENAKTWVGNETAVEEYLKTAKITKIENIGTGVTNPKRAYLEPGGLCESMAWKPIRPGMYQGYWESYKAEIAAYQIDKLLDLHMIPPTVERRIDGDKGAAVMWASPTKSFKELGGLPSAPPQHFASWNRQIVDAKMFDDLIGNRDPNLGNWLVDPAWNLILIDHTRALTNTKDRPHQLTRIDRELWDKMNALTEESLTAAVGEWLGKGEIKAILERRTKMQEDIDKLVKKNGEAAVFIQ
jgi:hypothetical protein